MSVGARWISGVAVTAVIALLGFTGLSIPPVHAQSNGQSEVQIGLNISPVTLNMHGRNPSLVGKGSFIVNAKGDCNGCHNSPDLGGEFAAGHNPYFGQPKQINANGYLGGGEQFGPFPGVGPGGVGPLIVYPRNLTPDISGRPIGGATFQEFQAIMRTGHDFDNAHPACPTLGVLGCLASPPPLLRRHSSAGHALASLREHVRRRPPRYLRILERDPLHLACWYSRSSAHPLPDVPVIGELSAVSRSVEECGSMTSILTLHRIGRRIDRARSPVGIVQAGDRSPGFYSPATSAGS